MGRQQQQPDSTQQEPPPRPALPQDSEALPTRPGESPTKGCSAVQLGGHERHDDVNNVATRDVTLVEKVLYEVWCIHCKAHLWDVDFDWMGARGG